MSQTLEHRRLRVLALEVELHTESDGSVCLCAGNAQHHPNRGLSDADFNEMLAAKVGRSSAPTEEDDAPSESTYHDARRMIEASGDEIRRALLAPEAQSTTRIALEVDDPVARADAQRVHAEYVALQNDPSYLANLAEEHGERSRQTSGRLVGNALLERP